MTNVTDGELLEANLREAELLRMLHDSGGGSAQGDKTSAFDLLCQTTGGDEVLIEIQLSPQDYFRDRTLYYALQEQTTSETMTKALNFTYVELPKFIKTQAELVTEEDKFYFCLAHMSELGERPGNLDEKFS